MKLFFEYYKTILDSGKGYTEFINTYKDYCTVLSAPAMVAIVEQMLSDNEGLFMFEREEFYMKFSYTFSNSYYSGPAKLIGSYSYHSVDGPFVTVPAFKALQY